MTTIRAYRASHPNNFPKLHNAAWPGVVGKGPDSEPPIDLDTMLDLTAAAEVDGVKFDGVDLFLFAPHVDIDSSDDDLKRLADKVRQRKLVDRHRSSRRFGRRPAAARRWAATTERKKFLEQVRKGCRIAQRLRELGIRPYGVVRIDSACGRGDWHKAIRRQTASGSPRPSARPATSPRISASGWPPREKSAGAACTVGGGWCSCWKWSIGPRRSASRPTWPTRCSTRWATTRRKTRSCRKTSTGRTPGKLERRCSKLTAALRPWTIDFHVAQNDATVHGSGSHDKTGRHCLPNDPNGKLDIAQCAGFWLRDEHGQLTKQFRHICWDGCMFPNDDDDEAAKPGTAILAAMVAVRDAHGWKE